MVDETTKVDIARQDRIRQEQAEKPKVKPKEDFGDVLKKSQIAQPVLTTPLQSRTLTQQAIQESAKKQDQQSEEQKKDEREQDKKGETRQDGKQTSTKTVDHKVVGKATLKQGGSGGGESGHKGGGFDGALGRRSLSKQLTKAGARSIPTDLQSRFASRLAQATKPSAAQEAALTQQVLNKLVQYVRMGINRAGEKEIQVDLHEKIFRGLKLRVTSRGGKVDVHFRTADAKGRAIFKKQSSAIRAALASKGIDVAEITIT